MWLKYEEYNQYIYKWLKSKKYIFKELKMWLVFMYKICDMNTESINKVYRYKDYEKFSWHTNINICTK